METINDPIEQDEKNLHQFLDYIAKNPNAVVRFQASDMILRADTDASYLTEPEACSHAAGYFFLGGIPFKMYKRAFEWPNTRKSNFKICCRF